MEKFKNDPGHRFRLIIDINLNHEGGMNVARELVHIEIIGYDQWLSHGRSRDTVEYLDNLAIVRPADHDLRTWQGIANGTLDHLVDLVKARYTPHYVYADLTAGEIRNLLAVDEKAALSALFRIWPDFEVEATLTDTVATVKANAARTAFSAAGEGIVWAVADTGVDGSHIHFVEHNNLDLSDWAAMSHVDFTRGVEFVSSPRDPNGHGTHVAGIIAGESVVEQDELGLLKPELWAGEVELDVHGDRVYSRRPITKSISGVAPMTTIVSLQVLGKSGTGNVSNLLAAIGYVQEMNDYGRSLRIHGMNMSVGYGFDPEWFGCGQSPLCVEVDRLVHSGVSVVVAAGNTGYWKRGRSDAAINSGLDITINDPGNAEEAITVGSTHRVAPHTYGISYFSSKGPTGDGRFKPDLVAPGEKVLSCAAGDDHVRLTLKDDDQPIDYRRESGTSMAAPHVSGAIAAFLSARTEFIGKPQRVKEIFLETATDLGRDKYFQGHGLIDLMRAIQSV
jgi:subtilisin family serine protease